MHVVYIKNNIYRMADLQLTRQIFSEIQRSHENKTLSKKTRTNEKNKNSNINMKNRNRK